MAATIKDLEQLLTENRIEFFSVRTPKVNGSKWQASVRDLGAGWSVGDFKPTLFEAVENAVQKKRGWTARQKPADDLEDLLG